MRIEMAKLTQAEQQAILARAGATLRAGGLVAFPTETVYGLGANALSEQAVARIFKAKGRPSDNPLIVHLGSAAAVFPLVDDAVRAKVALLAERFWPGPLTLVVPHQGTFPPNVTAGLATVGLRIPAHPLALALIAAAGVPIAAPSANRSGRPSPTTGAHVEEDLAGQVELILDAGPTGVGVESTVLDLSVTPPMLLRPGGVTLEDLRAVLGEVVVDPGSNGTQLEAIPRAPGMKYRHYAPETRVVLVTGPFPAAITRLGEVAAMHSARGQKVGLMLSLEGAAQLGKQAYPLRIMGSRQEPAGIAARIFALLRELDHLGLDLILVEGVAEEGLGLAIMNRLKKAASTLLQVN